MLFLIAVDTLREIARFACSDAGDDSLAVGSDASADLRIDGVVGIVARFRRAEGAWWIERSSLAPIRLDEHLSLHLGVWTLYAFARSDQRMRSELPPALSRFALQEGAIAALVDASDGRRLEIRGPAPAILGSADCCRLRLPREAQGVLAIVVAADGLAAELHPIPSHQIFRNDALVTGPVRLEHGDLLTDGNGVALRFDDPAEAVDRLLSPVDERDAGPRAEHPSLRARAESARAQVAGLVAADEAVLWLVTLTAVAVFAIVFWSRY
jgi:hypothetical protein